MNWIEELTKSGASIFSFFLLMTFALLLVLLIMFFRLWNRRRKETTYPEESLEVKADSTALVRPSGEQNERSLTSNDQALEVAPTPSRLRLLGLILGLLSDHTAQEQPTQLSTALARLGDGNQEMARGQLSTLALALMGEDQATSNGEFQLREFLAAVLEEDLAEGIPFSSMPEFQQAIAGVSPELRQKLDTIVWSRNADSVNLLTSEDVEALERVAVAMATAMVIDNSYHHRSKRESEPESNPELTEETEMREDPGGEGGEENVGARRAMPDEKSPILDEEKPAELAADESSNDSVPHSSSAASEPENSTEASEETEEIIEEAAPEDSSPEEEDSTEAEAEESSVVLVEEHNSENESNGVAEENSSLNGRGNEPVLVGGGAKNGEKHPH